MIFKDFSGNTLNKGDVVVIPFNGDLIPANIVEIQTGLGAQGQEAIPGLILEVLMLRFAGANGAVPGVHKMNVQQDQNKVQL